MKKLFVMIIGLFVIFNLFSTVTVTAIPVVPVLSHADYVIITTNDVVENSEEFEFFVNLKQFLGHDVLVVTEDDYGDLTGEWPNQKPEKIRKWLINNYESLGIEYVLLIGNPDPDNPDDPNDSVGDLPMKWCVPKYYVWEEQDVPTDYFYADLSGDWDLDGDGLFGEEISIDNPLSPDPLNVNADYFSVWWGGSVNCDVGGDYVFQIYCDDEVQLMIDGVFVIDNVNDLPKPLPLSNKAATVHLDQGFHSVQLRYREHNGDAMITLLWKKPGAEHFEVVGGDFLYDAYDVQGGLTGFYYHDMFWNDFALERGPERVDFFWGTGDQGVGGPKPGGDVFVGRIPVYNSNYGELDGILRKIILYETDPGDISWRKSVLLPMVRHSENIPGYPLGEHIKNGVADPMGFDSFRIYDEDFGVSPELTPCTFDNVKEEWKNGYGLVVWATHGNQQLAHLVMNTTYTGELDDSKPSFTFQASCSNAYPENSNNLAYDLLRNGAICTVGATRISGHDGGNPDWPLNPDNDANHNMAYYYTENLVRYGMNAGQALYLMQKNYPKITANGLTYNIFGDPECYLTMTVDNLSPIADAGGPYFAGEGDSVWFAGGSSYDPEGDALEYRWDYNNDGNWDTQWSNSPFIRRTWFDDYEGEIRLQVRDGLGFVDSDLASVTILNEAPFVNPGSDMVAVEGDELSFSGSFYDPGPNDGPHYVVWDFGDGSRVTSDLTPTHAYGDDGRYEVTFSVRDKDNGLGLAWLYVDVENGAPSILDFGIDSIDGNSILPFIQNTLIGNFSDPGWLDNHEAIVDFGDGSFKPGLVEEENEEPQSTGLISVNHTFTQLGTYQVSLTLTDDDGDSNIEYFEINVVDEFGAMEEIYEYIDDLPDSAFARPNQSRKALDNMFNTLQKMLDKGKFKAAIEFLSQNIRCKLDESLGNNPNSEWITDVNSRNQICARIDNLIAYLQYLCDK